jgi:uncharacterized membrane protein YeaQ/YmgE (transglycosylase-associated protein family)
VSFGLVIGILLTGFIVGGLARFAIPGPDPMPLWLTIAIGLVGSIFGAAVGRSFSGGGYLTSFLAFGVSIALVAAYRRYVQKRPILGAGALEFPERGFGVEHYRERLKRFGLDPDNLAPDPKRIEKARLLAALDELHRAGLIDDDELAAKRAQVEERA